MLDRLYKYEHKLRILRQIQSNKERYYSRVNIFIALLTIVVSSLLTFMGFAGLDKIKTYVNWFFVVDQMKVEFAFSILVLIVFVLVTLHLVFRYSQKEAQAWHAVVSLTNLINELDDLFAREDQGIHIPPSEIYMVRQKYESLIQNIPKNTDREFVKARKDHRLKESNTLKLEAKDAFSPKRQREVLEALVRSSDILTRIVETLREHEKGLYLAGGLVRNLLWDFLHGYKVTTPLEDVDVVYFDASHPEKEHDTELEETLHEALPNFDWSVKNQARMHAVNNDEPYRSLEDAISRFPDTATAFALCLKENGRFELIAPYGLDDLFRLTVAPTPHFKSKLHLYQKRISSKDWRRKWPRLRFLEMD